MAPPPPRLGRQRISRRAINLHAPAGGAGGRPAEGRSSGQRVEPAHSGGYIVTGFGAASESAGRAEVRARRTTRLSLCPPTPAAKPIGGGESGSLDGFIPSVRRPPVWPPSRRRHSSSSSNNTNNNNNRRRSANWLRFRALAFHLAGRPALGGNSQLARLLALDWEIAGNLRHGHRAAAARRVSYGSRRARPCFYGPSWAPRASWGHSSGRIQGSGFAQWAGRAGSAAGAKWLASATRNADLAATCRRRSSGGRRADELCWRASGPRGQLGATCPAEIR